MAAEVHPLQYTAELATLVQTPPDSDEWLSEFKYDGYRMGLIVEGGRVRWKSRHGNDWTHALPELAAAAAELRVTTAVLDGELAVLLPSGLTTFHGLQNALRLPPTRRQLVFFAFDLHYANGRDLRKTALERRKSQLRDLLAPLCPSHPFKYVDHIFGAGARVFGEAARLGAEGIVSKRRRSLHRPGRSRDWLKTKCLQTHDFVVCGYRDPEGSRWGVGELLLGHYDERGQLRYAGSVGTGKGFTRQFLQELRGELSALQQASSPFARSREAGPHTHWIKPVLVIEVGYTQSPDGALRHPSVQRFRPDVRAQSVVFKRG